MKKLLLALFSIVLLGALSQTAFAIGNGDISISPTQASDAGDPRTQSWFIYSFAPGTVHNDSVSVRNESNETRTIKLYAVDGYTTAQGGFALRGENDPKETVGKWLTLEKMGLTLQPQEEAAVPFQYSVPLNAEPGEYAGGIVAEDTQKIQGQGISVVKRVGVRLYHTVPGDRLERITLIGSEMKEINGERWFEATVLNAGNVSLTLALNETITHKDGSAEAAVSSEPSTVLPKSRVMLKTTHFKDPLFGSFVAKGTIYNGAKPMGELPAYTFMIVNPLLIAAAGVVLLILIIVLLLTNRNKKKKKNTIKHKKK